MTAIDLTEYGPARSVRLDDAVGRTLAASRVIEAVPDSYAAGQWRLRAVGKVGVVTVTAPDGRAVTVRIAPKVPIGRLLFLLGYSLDPKGWRTGDVQVAKETGLLPVFARLFERQAEHALRQGVLQGYRSTEETALRVRGRIREADQVRRRFGQPLPVEIIHDEYTVDIAENRLLHAACERLCRMPGGIPADVRGRLRRLAMRLVDVTPIRRGEVLPVWRPSRLNIRYHPALLLADLVLRGASVEHRAGEVTVSGFLFDIAVVFEDFVTVALSESLAGSGRCVRHPTVHLDQRCEIGMLPDLVRYTDDGAALAVVDAKYKAHMPEADLYQMLAYCTALGLRDGHLVYAKGNTPHTEHFVRRAGVTIHQHALDLDQPPDGLLADVRRLALRLVAPVPA